jgi:hypothetical protein
MGCYEQVYPFISIQVTEENSPSLDLQDPEFEIYEEYDLQISNINKQNEFYIILLNKRTN